MSDHPVVVSPALEYVALVEFFSCQSVFQKSLTHLLSVVDGWLFQTSENKVVLVVEEAIALADRHNSVAIVVCVDDSE